MKPPHANSEGAETPPIEWSPFREKKQWQVRLAFTLDELKPTTLDHAQSRRQSAILREVMLNYSEGELFKLDDDLVWNVTLDGCLFCIVIDVDGGYHPVPMLCELPPAMTFTSAE